MKKQSVIKILVAILLVALTATFAVACNPDHRGDNKTYTLSFIVEGETVAPISAKAGAQITPPTPPQKQDMNFVGWFLNNEGEAVEIPTVMPAEDRTYYGRYETVTDEEVRVPDDYNIRFSTDGSDKGLYLKGDEVYVELGEKVIKTALSDSGDYADFSDGDKDYCALLDYSDNKYGVYEYAYDKNANILYLPMDNTFNFERCLFFDSETAFRIWGYSNENDWALGTYVGGSDGEYNLTVTKDNSYGMIGNWRVKLTKRVRRSEDTGKDVIYSAFTVFDNSIYGKFTSTKDGSLSLDGYGFGTYTDASGKKCEGVCESVSVKGFSDEFVDFINSETGETYKFIVNAGNDSTLFLKIGNEVGLHRVYDVVEGVAGSYYLLMDGQGTAYVFYGSSTIFYPEYQVATATYEILEGGVFRYTFENVEDGKTMDDKYKTDFDFKLTTYTSNGSSYEAFAIYDETIAGVWSAENGQSTITLDGYGYATHSEDGGFTGKMEMSDDLLLITAEDNSQRIFRYSRNGNTVSFRRIGLEIGNYMRYSYIKGLKETVRIHLNGEGSVGYYVLEEGASEFTLKKSGTYSAVTDAEGKFNVTFEDETSFDIYTCQINFGSLYYPDWKTVYIEYDPAMAGTFTAQNGATLVLDGYGRQGVYTDGNGKITEGEFAKEWKLVTFRVNDEEGNIFVFAIAGNTFELKTEEAGVHYMYSPEDDVVSDRVRVMLDGSGNASYSTSEYGSDEYTMTDATYTYDAQKEEYTLTFADSTPSFKFILDKRNGYGVFVKYNEEWTGTYIDASDRPFVLDGYGRFIYRDERFSCTVLGENKNIVVDSGYGRIFVLNKTKGEVRLESNAPSEYTIPTTRALSADTPNW